MTLSRDEQIIGEFMYNIFKEGTHYTQDGWTSYNFLNDIINYSHENHNHGRGWFWWIFPLFFSYWRVMS